MMVDWTPGFTEEKTNEINQSKIEQCSLQFNDFGRWGNICEEEGEEEEEDDVGDCAHRTRYIALNIT